MSAKQRDRGRILTPDGLSRLQQAIRAWELEHEVRCTQERIKELTSAVKEGGLDPSTIRKILKAKEGVDPESIRYLFTTFGLQLDETDLVSSSRFQFQADPNFVGREGAIADLNTLVNRGMKAIVIQARGGVGKTTLARKYLQQEFGSFLEFPIAKETKDIASIESLIEEKLRQLGEEPGREFFVSLDRLKRKLQDERIGILIDNLEPALDAAGKFIEPHRRYVELLRVLADPAVQSVTLITSRERLNEYSISVQHYPLRDLSLEAWKQYFQNRFQLFAAGKDLGNEDESVLAALHNAYGGNAKAMDILCGAILTDYAGDMAAYWQANRNDLLIERPLEDLVVGQFDRLQQADPDAYNLLCRMGCYRYQDVPTVPIEGLLCLLWDVPENRQRRVVKALQERSLVEFQNEEYWLHPVIRGEAIRRLRESEDWEVANQTAANFWTDLVQTIKVSEDTMRALEAYYHYISIHNLEQAASVIIRQRKNQLGTNESLGHSFYKHGLFRHLIGEIDYIKDKLGNGYQRAKLYKYLGAVHQLTEDINRAIEFYKTSQHIASESLNFETTESEIMLLKVLIMNSWRGIGNCQIYIGDYEKALEFYKYAEAICKELANLNYRKTILFYIAYINSLLGNFSEARCAADEIYKEVKRLSNNSLPSWLTEYRLVLLGRTYNTLGKIEKADKLYERAIQLTHISSYTQSRAMALSGQAVLNRGRGHFDLACARHTEAVQSLQKIGATFELAEAYYQFGLTYQAMGENERSDTSFQEAIRLFNEVKAPRQVDRVRRSMLANTDD